MHRARLLLVVATLAVNGCSVDAGGGDGRPDAAETTTTTSPPEPIESTTTLAPSVGIVEVAEVTYEVEAACYAPGAGELVVTGLAVTESGSRVEVYVQAFVGQPYVGITVIDDDTTTRYEPAVDRPLDITLLDDIVRADDVALVTDLDLETGEGVDAGVGTVVIECRSYEEELPPGFAAG